MRQAIPRHSPLLPALRDPCHVVDRLQLRQQLLTDSGDLTEAGRMAVRAGRVARWQEEAQVARTKPAVKPKTQTQKPFAISADVVDALIAEVNVGKLLNKSHAGR
jgi:hypothetical protein